MRLYRREKYPFGACLPPLQFRLNQATSPRCKEERKSLLNDLLLISGRDLVGKHQPGSTEETTSTSTKTETGKDGSKTTTTTTTTTKKTQGNSP